MGDQMFKWLAQKNQKRDHDQAVKAINELADKMHKEWFTEPNPDLMRLQDLNKASKRMNYLTDNNDLILLATEVLNKKEDQNLTTEDVKALKQRFETLHSKALMVISDQQDIKEAKQKELPTAIKQPEKESKLQELYNRFETIFNTKPVAAMKDFIPTDKPGSKPRR